MSGSHPHPDHAQAHAGSHGSVKGYVVGFVLSLVLTALSFWAVKSGVVPHGMILPAIVVLAVVQLLVQLVFFLHMGTAADQRDNLSIGVFTLLIIAIIVCGSLWVMHNMNANMMHPMDLMPGMHGH